MESAVSGTMGLIIFLWIITVLVSVVIVRWIFKINKIVDELRIIRRLIQIDLEGRRPELKDVINKEIKHIQWN